MSTMDTTVYDLHDKASDVFDQDNMSDGTVNKNYTATDKVKVDHIAVTGDIDLDTAVLDTAGDASGFDFVVDENDMASDSAVKLPTQASVKAYVDGIGVPRSASGDEYKMLVVKPDFSGFQILKRAALSPYDFGWRLSDTAADRTAALKAWAADSRPGFLEALTDYEVDISGGAIEVAAGKIIEGYKCSIYDEANIGTLMKLVPGAADGDGILAGGWQLSGFRLRGTGNGTVNAAGIGLDISGVDNVATLTAPDYVLGPILQDMIVEEFAGYCVSEIFGIGSRYTNPRFTGAGYACYGGSSIKNMRMVRHVLKDLGAGIGSSAYGAYASHNVAGDRLGNLTVSPRPEDFQFREGLIEDNTLYTAIDCHGGIDGKFIDNVIRNCQKGINCGSENTTGDNPNGPLNCEIRGNILYGLLLDDDDAVTSPAISLVGGLSGGADNAVAANGYAKNCLIIGNQIYGWGNRAGANNCGMLVQVTKNSKIIANTVEHCARTGILLKTRNYGFVCTENSVTDSYASGSVAAGIGANSSYNYGIIGDNHLRNDGGVTDTLVMSRAVYLENLATIDVDLTGDRFVGSIATRYFVGSGALVRTKPVRRSVKVSIAITGGASSGSATVTFANYDVVFSAVPTIVGVNGPSVFDSKNTIYGFSSLGTTTVSITARTAANGDTYATGGTVEVHVEFEGW